MTTVTSALARGMITPGEAERIALRQQLHTPDSAILMKA
jgi:hypothetical protein